MNLCLIEESAPVFEAIFDAFFGALVTGVVVAASFGEVGLGDISALVIVAVLVAGVAEGFFGAWRAAVAEVSGHGESYPLLDIGLSGEERGVSAIGFGSGGEVDRAMGEGDLGFWEADKIGGLLGGDGEDEGLGIGEADVFAGEDDEASGDEAEVFARVEHFGEPVEGGVGVGAADTFDEGGDGIVVLVAVLVIDHGFFLDTFFGDGVGDVDDSEGIRWGGDDGDLQGIEALAGIAIGRSGEMEESGVFDGEGHFAEAAEGIGEGAFLEIEEIFDGKGFELKDLGARDEGGVDGEEGVMGGGADEADGSAFDIWEEGILLGFVPAVDFVDEEDGFFLGVGESMGGGGDDFAEVGEITFDAAEAFEAGAGGGGDNFCEGGFASAWGAEEDDGGDAIGIDGAAEEFSWGEDVRLAGIFVERSGAHSLGEGGGGGGGRREVRGRREKVWHGERIRVGGKKDENGREDILWV